jgi:hypothetical protein
VRERNGLLARVAVAVAVVVSATGCANAGRQQAETVFKRLANGDIELDLGSDGRVTVRGDSFSTGGKVPADWPKDVPLPADLKVRAAVRSDTAGGPTFVVDGGTAASVPEVRALYEQALRSWTSIGDRASSASASEPVQLAYRSDKRLVVVEIRARAGSGADLAVSVATMP